jgi:hypothetical protein
MHLHNMHRVTTPALCLALLACQPEPAVPEDTQSVSAASYVQQLEATLVGAPRRGTAEISTAS